MKKKIRFLYYVVQLQLLIKYFVSLLSMNGNNNYMMQIVNYSYLLIYLKQHIVNILKYVKDPKPVYFYKFYIEKFFTLSYFLYLFKK